jgi:ankyrin repeat protein
MNHSATAPGRLGPYALVWIFILTAMIAFPAICNASTESRLAMAIRHRDLPVVMSLLRDGVNVNERDEGVEQTPLMRAALAGDPQIAEALLKHGADVNAQDDEGNTALMLAANSGATRVAELLLQYGATPNSRNAGGATALSLARSRGRTNIARLIERAAVRQKRSLT